MPKKHRLNTIQRKQQRKKEEEYIDDLNVRIEEYDPKLNYKSEMFQDFPISDATIKGLKESAFIKMTDIQKQSIPYSLKGYDILGAAKTGSGKTLSFLIPVIEKLYREKWTEFDGLGALIISPTRELAMQIYEVLVKIGKHCSFSAGLVIGGKDVKFELERVSKINILIGTPGRILQHMDQAVGLNISNLQILVLDEADRCLDMGFKQTLDAIINNLPATRQTLLFSATQSQSLSDLARLSLTDYKTIGSIDTLQREHGPATPETLHQSFVQVRLQDKLDNLFSFIKSHLKSKIIVFLSSSKQVHFIYETFRKMQPGMSLMHLHGRQKQTARIETLDKFSRAHNACLFSTDVIARGIDFPSVDWVIQVDCPEDVDTYIHRVGRCARYGKQGKSLIMLTPQEEPGFLKRLNSRQIEPDKLTIKQSMKKSIKNQLQSLLFKDPELKYLGQKAFISYIRSIYIQKDKEVFDFEGLEIEEFAMSLGLPGAPKVKIKGMKAIERAKILKNTSRQLLSLSVANEDGEISNKKAVQGKTKYDKMFGRKNQTVLSEHYLNISNLHGQEEEEEGDFVIIKRLDHDLNDGDIPQLVEPTSKRSQKKALSKKASLSTKGNPQKLKFDDEGIAHPIYELQDEEEFHKEGDAKLQKEKFLSKESEIMSKMDIKDKQTVKEKKREKKRKKLESIRREMEAEMDDQDGYSDYTSTTTNLSAGKLNEDMEHSESESDRPIKKKQKYQQNYSRSNNVDQNIIEMEEPQTLEDLESLTSKLIHG